DNYGIEFVMLPNRVVQFFEITHSWRTIWTDGRKLPENPPEPRWLGWNAGHWEGDTLVVESNGYDDRSWIEETGGLGGDGGWTHIFFDVFREHIERHISAEHDGVIERLQIELRAERLLREIALTIDLAVSDLVAARLTGPGTIAIDFARDLERIRSVGIDEKL